MSMSEVQIASEPNPRVLRLDRRDNVLVAVTEVPASSRVDGVAAVQDIPAGHKLAASPIASGEPVRKFGQIIGFASQPIRAGEHVHEHNCAYGEFSRDSVPGIDYK